MNQSGERWNSEINVKVEASYCKSWLDYIPKSVFVNRRHASRCALVLQTQNSAFTCFCPYRFSDAVKELVSNRKETRICSSTTTIKGLKMLWIISPQTISCGLCSNCCYWEGNFPFFSWYKKWKRVFLTAGNVNYKKKSSSQEQISD